LGRLDEAATMHEEGIQRAEKLNDQRQVAAVKVQLGTVRLNQQRYAEALEIYIEARQIFERLGEPGTVATTWHQIGMVYRLAGQYDQAERAYRQALAIKVQQKNRSGEGSTMTELGNLYNEMGRLEEAVTFFRQAADIYGELQDLAQEGLARNNIASTLLDLRRYGEARRELNRAIECNQPFGHAAEPWKTWGILYDLEHATGNAPAAAQARQQAIEAYLAYRRAGGESHRRGTAYLCTIIAQSIQQGQVTTAVEALPQLVAEANVSEVMAPKLQAILAGERSSALADDPNLYYRDAVELRLLLEKLAN
jgi:tetratricopeptide (TPR) repeat protein